MGTYEEIPKIEYARRYFMNIEQAGHDCIPIEKFYGPEKEWYKPGVVCYVMKKKVVNDFQMEDSVYYFLHFKKPGWWPQWASERNANISKYVKEKIAGTSVSKEIYLAAINDKRMHRSALVTTMPLDEKISPGSTDPKLEFNYLKIPDLKQHHEKYGGLFTSTWGEEEIGIPKTIYVQKDVF